MKKFIKFEKDAEKVFMYPNGSIANTERIIADFPATQYFAHIIETDDAEQVLFAIENASAMRSRMGIDAGLSDEEAIAEITRIANEEPEQEINDNTRIADALEDLVVLSMPDLDE